MHFDVVSGHSFGNVLPSAEHVTLFFWYVLRFYGFAIFHVNRNIYFSVDDERHFVSVDRERTSDGDVIGRHGGGRFAPSAECVPFFFRRGLLRDVFSVCYLNALVFLSVNNIDDVVRVDSV